MIQSRDIPVGSVVGINYGGLHDSAVAIVTPDGEPIFSMALERLSRAKQDGRPPNKLLEQMPWEKISKVAVPARLMNDEGHQTTSSILSTRLEVPIPYGKFGHPEEFSEFISTARQYAAA
jgi:predicted NodU family carbamoyl transferase